MMVNKDDQLWEDFMETMATLLDVGYEMPVALQMKAAEEMEGSSRAWRNALSAVKDEERPEAAAVDGVSEDMKSEGSEDMSEGSEDEEVVHAVITDHGSAIGLLTECNPAEVTEVTVVTPVRRGRGRPPKQKGVVVTPAVRDQSGGKGEPKVKRPRGRPPRLVYGIDAGKKPFHCSICGKGLSAQSSLDIHMRTHTGERPYVCEQCGRCFSQLAGLVMHQKTHSNVRDCLCKHCDYSAKQRIDVVRHQLRHHSSEKPFLCEVCGKGFVEVWSLQLHSTTHNKEKKDCVCDQCDFRTHNVGILRSHKRNLHRADRQMFECKLCGAELRYRDTYEGHLRRHFGEKPYKCKECSAAFASTSQLAAHRHIHKERAYACGVCAKRFVSRHKLERHAVIHTDKKLFGCPACAYCCNVKSNLKKHCHAVHDILYPPPGLARVLRLNTPRLEASEGDRLPQVKVEGERSAASPPDAPRERRVIDPPTSQPHAPGGGAHPDLTARTDEAGNFLLFITECGAEGGNVMILREDGEAAAPVIIDAADPDMTSFHEVTVSNTEESPQVLLGHSMETFSYT